MLGPYIEAKRKAAPDRPILAADLNALSINLERRRRPCCGARQ
jgi:hypothetical protein